MSMNEHYEMHIIFRVFFILIIASIVLGLFFNGSMMNSMYGGWFWNIAGIFLAIWFAGWLLRWPMRREWKWDHELTILRRRYARGEISKKQYRKMLKTLEESEDFGKIKKRKRR